MMNVVLNQYIHSAMKEYIDRRKESANSVSLTRKISMEIKYPSIEKVFVFFLKREKHRQQQQQQQQY